MKKILINKKMILFLAVGLLLIVFLIWTQFFGVEISDIYDQPDKFKNDKIFAEKSKQKKIVKTENEVSKEKINEVKNETQLKTKIKEIALISEIKDPFKSVNSSQNSKKRALKSINKPDQLSESNNKENYNPKLIDLEKNIIADDLNNHSSKDNKLQVKNNNSNEAKKINIERVKLPFKLLGIIRKGTKSTALFLYRGQTVTKKENDKIGRFTIKKINNNKLTISYQKAERMINLWEVEGNEK
ncbi:hypothetical protein [Halanaerobium kushneri]|uniref:Uncharacterized protein n=1 Tax=Halanaerobium kushneri TaxID=56779 RepID=A0A1N6Q4T0_9FIRM|nr:hypothetical protein [Halanaerobium kushneri]SIQ11572.1 hypothetical protein SAMN05421834_101324 [Halanaerobium kushneri]